MYQIGTPLYTNDFFRGKNLQNQRLDDYQLFSLRFSKNTIGENSWEQLYNYPNWGIGLSIADFHNPLEIGNPFCIYGFFDAPFKRWNRLSLNYDIAFGTALDWKNYNPVTNPFNIAIGAPFSFIINTGLNLEYDITKHIGIRTGLSFNHFSNGALKVPNKGINAVTPLISIKYNYNDYPVYKREIPKFSGNNEWSFSVYSGVKNLTFDSANVDVKEKHEGVFYPEFGLSALYSRQISYKSEIGIGMTVGYNGAANAQVAVDNNELEPVKVPLYEKIQVSIYPSYELVIDKMSIVIQPGIYLYRNNMNSFSSRIFQKIGLKYFITNNIFAGLTLNAYNYYMSDFIGWSVGYRIKY
jgi:hypothetical protein